MYANEIAYLISALLLLTFDFCLQDPYALKGDGAFKLFLYMVKRAVGTVTRFMVRQCCINLQVCLVQIMRELIKFIIFKLGASLSPNSAFCIKNIPLLIGFRGGPPQPPLRLRSTAWQGETDAFAFVCYNY